MSAGAEEKSSLPGRLIDYLDRRINPVLLRDLRLYMRGRMMLAVYFLTLAALVLLAVLYAIIARFDGTDGTALLSILSSLLAVICGAMIPNLVFERFRSELANKATELALTTPLTAAQLVRGKLLGAWCMALMVISASSPMLATAYLLGGINITSLLGVMAGVTLAGMVMPVLQLYMAADHKGGKGASRAIAAMLFVSQLVLMLMYARLLNGTFVGGGYRWADTGYALVFSLSAAGILIGQFLYCCAVAVIRGEAEDRDVIPRISLTAASFIGGLCAFAVQYYYTARGTSHADLFEPAAIAVCIVAYAFCGCYTAVTHSSPAVPRSLHEKWHGRRFSSLLLLPGVHSLTAYFFFNAVFLFVIPFSLASFGLDEEDFWKYLCIALAPYMAILYGIAAYRFAALPILKDRRNPKLLSHTITIANVVLAFMSIFGMVMASYVLERSELYSFVLGAAPVGLVAAAADTRTNTAGTGSVGMIVTALLSLVLLASSGRASSAPPPAEKENGHAP